MKKINLLFLPLFLSLCGTAPAFFTDSLVTGDANNLHLKADFEWTSYLEDREGGGYGHGTLAGSWEGGTYTLSSSIIVLHLSDIELEVRVDGWLRTFWNDGYDPGWLGTYSIGTTWRRPMWSSKDPWIPNPYGDYSENDLQYTLTGFGLIELVVEGDYTGAGGTGTTTWDISRTPYNVPDSGSTLAMFSVVAFTLLAVFKK